MTRQEAIKIIYDKVEILIDNDTEPEVFTAMNMLETIAYPKDKIKTEDMHEDLFPRPYFQQWAKNNGVDMKYEDDWRPWWDCWCNGYNKGIEDIKEIM
jgi:hypothetical protein